MNFAVKKISGFKSLDSVILVRDERGQPFYYYENKTGKPVHFNLPPGQYSTKNTIVPAEVRIYLHEPPPTPNRDIKLPGRIKVKVKKNDAKCSIYLDSGTIVLDPEFFKKLKGCKPALTFVLLHEKGHYKYGGFHPVNQEALYKWAEQACDIYAAAEMYKRGFNPTQIVSSGKYTLSHFSEGRISNLSNFCSKHNTK